MGGGGSLVCSSGKLPLEADPGAAGSAMGAGFSCFDRIGAAGVFALVASEADPEVVPSAVSALAGILAPPRIAKNPATTASKRPPTTKGSRLGFVGA